MAQVLRVDLGATLRPPMRLADGGIRVDATLTRTGVFTYGKRREYRPPSEVFHPDSLASFANLTVTDDHPPEMISAQNRDAHKRGRVADEVAQRGSHMVGALLIDDAKLIRKMETGKRQVSNGYTADLDETPGVSPEGEPYDAIQRNIRGNHVAIVDAGRAGTASVRWDSAELFPSDADRADPTEDVNRARTDHQEIRHMDEMKKRLDEALANLATETARANAAAKRADEQETARKDAEKKLGESDGKCAAEKARADKAETDLAAEKTRKVDADGAAVEARVDAIVKGTKVLGDKVGDKPTASLATRAIQVAAVLKVDKVDLTDDKKFSADYVSARFDSACERAQAGAASLGETRRAVGVAQRATAAADAAPGDTLARMARAQEKNKRDSARAWRKSPGDEEADPVDDKGEE